MSGTDEYDVYVRDVQKALSKRMGYCVSLKSLPEGARDLIYLRLSRKDKISNNLIHNIALELSVLYKTELKKPTAKKVKLETSEERYQRTYHLYLGILITLVSGWFIFLFFLIIVNLIWKVITSQFH